MVEKLPENPPTTFWAIVGQSFTLDTEDKIAMASEDGFIKDTLSWLVVSELKDFRLAEDYYQAMGEYLSEQYGLGSEYFDRVYNLAENNLKEEVNHGEA